VNAIKRNIPNAITCLNLLCGCIALIFIFQNRLPEASYMVALAAVADFFDGMAARLLKVHSAIGKELDSLADMVTFGVVPGMMVFQMIGYSPLQYAGLCIPIFAALRLAKFNIDTRQTTYFIGVPTPAIALLIASFPLIMIHNRHFFDIFNTVEDYPSPMIWFFAILAIVCSALMVLPIRLLAMKMKDMTWTNNKARYILLIFSLASIIAFQFAAVPIIMVLYIVLSLFSNPAGAEHE
jgi:CDP-diacylglycerol--serine O-phosphatidyltransferase